MDFCLEIFKTFKFLTLNKLLNIWNQISLHILPLSLLCCFMVVFFFPLVFYYLSSTSDTQRVNINLAQEGRCRSYSSTGNWVSLNRFQHLYLKGNIWLFPPPREGKASSQRINSNFPVTSEDHMGEPSSVCMLLNDQMKKDYQVWEQSKFPYPLGISTAFFIDLTSFLLHSSNFHCYSCDFRRSFYEWAFIKQETFGDWLHVRKNGEEK